MKIPTTQEQLEMATAQEIAAKAEELKNFSLVRAVMRLITIIAGEMETHNA